MPISTWNEHIISRDNNIYEPNSSSEKRAKLPLEKQLEKFLSIYYHQERKLKKYNAIFATMEKIALTPYK